MTTLTSPITLSSITIAQGVAMDDIKRRIRTIVNEAEHAQAGGYPISISGNAQVTIIANASVHLSAEPDAAPERSDEPEIYEALADRICERLLGEITALLEESRKQGR